MRQGLPHDWDSILGVAVERIIPLRKRPFENTNCPTIVNMVSTVSILPQPDPKSNITYRLPLEAIALAFGQSSQYAPIQFAANILKVINSTAQSTTLVFSSGKIVLTSTLTEMHTQYISQLFRVIIEQVKCMMINNETGAITLGSLAGRTVFEKNITHNIVGSGNAGARIDLCALRDANPESVKYIPDLFPAAKCCIWLTPNCECICASLGSALIEDDPDVLKVLKKNARKKCSCTIKCHVFDSGNIVLIGGRTTKDVISVYFRMKDLVLHYKSESKTVPREDRFTQRLASMLVRTGETAKHVKVKARQEMTSSEAISLMLQEARQTKQKHQKVYSASTIAQRDGLTPLMKFADAGRLEEVKMMLAMEPLCLHDVDDKKRTAAQRLMGIERTQEQTRVLEFLRSRT